MAFLKRLIRALPLLVLSPFLMAISFLALCLVQLFTRRGGRILPPADVAQALVPGVSRLVSTPVRGRDTVSKASVGMSADAAGRSACATSRHSNTGEKSGLALETRVLGDGYAGSTTQTVAGERHHFGEQELEIRIAGELDMPREGCNLFQPRRARPRCQQQRARAA